MMDESPNSNIAKRFKPILANNLVMEEKACSGLNILLFTSKPGSMHSSLGKQQKFFVRYGCGSLVLEKRRCDDD